MTYELIDSGGGQKLERFGPYVLIRPCSQALWRKSHPEKWADADAEFSRENKALWTYRKKCPKQWVTEIGGVQFLIAPTDFGHLGAFPEHSLLWQDLREVVRKEKLKILNLFAYSGGATLALAQEGASVCHLDASKGMVDWARKNAALNQLEHAPIRWIVDDAMKFLKREERRETRYDAIILDPPTFGRGSQGEVFNIETDLMPLLQQCQKVLSNKPRFVVLSCHTPGVTPLVLRHVASQVFLGAQLETGEMELRAPGALSIPSGSYVKILYPHSASMAP